MNAGFAAYLAKKNAGKSVTKKVVKPKAKKKK